MAAECWWKITDQQQHQWRDLWASGAIVLAAIVFLVITETNSSWEKASLCPEVHNRGATSVHTFGLMPHSKYECCGRQVCSLTAEKIWFYSTKRLDSWSLHLCTAETTTVVHLFPFSACVFDISLQFCFFRIIFPSTALHRLFDEAPFLPPAHSNKKALCVFYMLCCHPALLEIRRTIFMHGFPKCQLPTCSWIQQSEAALRESSLWTIAQLCCSFSKAAGDKGGGWNREITTHNKRFIIEV